MERGSCVRPDERDALGRLVVDGAQAIVVTGSAGVGKSFLVREVARVLVADAVFARIVEVDVQRVRAQDAAGLNNWWRAIAEAVGSGTEPAQIARALEGAPTLLCIEAGVTFAEMAEPLLAWSETMPSCSVLVVARGGPHHPGWHRFEVKPLPTPSANALDGPAATYFVHLLKRMGVEVVEAEIPALCELIRLLDGLPLAMDLAAPRLRVMRPAVLVHRLRRSRSVLSASSGAESFDATLARSWNVLADDARHALTRLSVLSSPWSFETMSALLDHQTTAMSETLLDAGWLRATPEGMVLLSSLANFVQRQSQDAALVAAETCLAKSVLEARAGKTDAARQRRAAIHCAMARPRLDRAQAEAAMAMLAAAADAGALLDDGFEDVPEVPRRLAEGVLRASRGSGADPGHFVVALLLCARGAIRDGDWDAADDALGRASSVVASRGDEAEQAEMLLVQAMLQLARGHGQDAAVSARDARACWVRQGDQAKEAQALAILAEASAIRGDVASAVEVYARLVARPSLGEWNDVARLRGGWHRLNGGQWPEARAWLSEVSAPRYALLRTVLQAWLAHATGDAATAAVAYGRTLDAAPGGLTAALAAVGLGLLRAGAGGAAEATALFRRARHAAEAARRFDWARLAGELEHQSDAALAEVLRAPRIHPPGGPLGTLVDQLVGALSGEAAVPADRSIVARLAKEALGARPASQPDAAALVVHPAGRWFRPPNAEAASLAHRPILARVLTALSDARRVRPGDALSYADLMAAGWPQERMRADAGAHRVRVAISTLRKAGLRPQLQTVGGGYRLDPACPLVVQPD